MNLLPFVVIIIVVLTLFSLSQFEGLLSLKKENQIYRAYFRGLRERRNNKANKPCHKITPKNKKNTKTAKAKKAIKSTQKYFREERVGWEKGRLNLSSLLATPHKYPSLEAVAVQYIKRLYGKAEFFPKNDQIIKDLMETLIKEQQKSPPTPLHEITFSDPRLQDIFYKMMRGTHSYDLEGKGYPPFGEMFTFEQSNCPPMNYHYANISFLSLVVGEEMTKKFVELEKKQLIDAKKKSQSPIKPSTFKNLLKTQGIGDKNGLLELFEFSYRKSKGVLAKHQDSATQITVKVP
ncbi:MAG: hypothetical protein QNJ27_04750 [Simkaniaceae bacterium]|nr:hypothetical protein [Simkaniaceae bacterium]